MNDKTRKAIEVAKSSGIDGLTDTMLDDLIELIYVQRAALGMSRSILSRIDCARHPDKVIAEKLINKALGEEHEENTDSGHTYGLGCPECGAVQCGLEDFCTE